MRFLSVALAAIAVGGAIAAPAELEARGGSCMPLTTAVALANAFKDLIGEPFNKTLAIHAMTPTFHDYSDSVIELMDSGCPNGPVALGSATFASRAAFIQGQGAQKPIPFEILKVYNNCNSVTIRWMTPAPGTVKPEEPVRGIIVLETVPNTFNAHGQFDWKIQTVYSEFNSGAWLYDLVCLAFDT